MKVSTRFFKKGFFVCSILLASLFLLPKNVSASTSDVDNVFCNNIGTSHCFATQSGLAQGQIRQNEGFVNITVKMEGDEATPAIASPTNANDVKGVVTGGAHPTVDDELNLGGWNSIWDEGLESTATNGIILDVGTMVNGSATPDVNTINNGIRSAQNGNAYSPGYISGGTGITSPLPGVGGTNGHLFVHGYGGLQVRSSGKMILLNNNISIPIKITGLTAGTTYYARLRLVQNGGLGTVASTTIIPFATPADGATVFNAQETADTIAAGTSATVDPQTGLPKCGFIAADSSVLGCVAQVVYYVLFVPTSKIMALCGEIMDWGLGYSIDSNSYPVNGAGFITSGWRIMRDLANMLFIFILLYIAIATILDIGSINTGKMIGTVIVVALLINFSIFFCKVIVDSGNIFARLFYNQIVVTNSSTSNEITGQAGYKSISFAFAAKFNPTKLFDALNPEELRSSDPGSFAGAYSLFTLIASLVNLLAAYVFFMLAWFFISRTAGIWLAMIFSPIAFLSYALPFKVSLDILGHDKFWKELVGYAFMAPIALIMIFLIITFLDDRSFLAHLTTNTSTTGIFMGVIVPLLLISFLLLKTKDIAKDMAGKVGDAASSVGTFIGGAAVGVATGGAALAGRRVLGGLGSTLANNENLKKTAFGRGVISAGRRMETATYDVKNTKIAQFGLGQAGFNPNQAVNTTVKTNYKDYKQTQAEKREKYKESMKLSDKSQEVSQMNEAKESLDREKEKRSDARQKFDSVNKRFNAGLATQQERDAAAVELQNAEASHDTQATVYKDAKRNVDATNAKIVGGITKNIDISDQNIKDSWQNIGQQQGILNKTGATLKAVADTGRILGQSASDVVVGSLSGRAATVAKFRKEYQRLTRAATPPIPPNNPPGGGAGNPPNNPPPNNPPPQNPPNPNPQNNPINPIIIASPLTSTRGTGSTTSGPTNNATNAQGPITKPNISSAGQPNIFYQGKKPTGPETQTVEPQQQQVQTPISQPIKKPASETGPSPATTINPQQREQSINKQTKINSEGPGLRIIQTPKSGTTEVNIQGNAKVNFGAGVGVPKSPEERYAGTKLGLKPERRAEEPEQRVFQNNRSAGAERNGNQSVTSLKTDAGDKAADIAKTIGSQSPQQEKTYSPGFLGGLEKQQEAARLERQSEANTKQTEQDDTKNRLNNLGLDFSNK